MRCLWFNGRRNGLVTASYSLFFSSPPRRVTRSRRAGLTVPIDQRYEIPKAAHVYYVATDGKTDSPGTTLDQPTTLESAIERVVTGDAIVMRGGVYRTGGLILNQGITLQPYADERPILKGTQVATKWEALRNNVWRTSWTRLFPAAPLGWWRRDTEGMRTPLHRFNNDMVFVDGELLKSAGWEGELDAHSFYIDYQGGYVYIGVDPTNRLVEITAFDSALVRTSAPAHGKTSDHKGPAIRGITFTQYAYRALEVEGKKHFTVADEPTDEPVGLSDPATFGKEVVGTLLENVTITYCSRVAGYFRGDGLVIRNSLISDTGTEGIYVIGSSDVLLERNIIRRNNRAVLASNTSGLEIFDIKAQGSVPDRDCPLVLPRPMLSPWSSRSPRDPGRPPRSSEFTASLMERLGKSARGYAPVCAVVQSLTV